VIVQASPRAERQLRSARIWWLQNRDKAPEVFDEEILRARELLSNQPSLGRPLRTRRGRMVRRLTLGRIRYYLYYRVYPDHIEVISLWHTSRRPPRL